MKKQNRRKNKFLAGMVGLTVLAMGCDCLWQNRGGRDCIRRSGIQCRSDGVCRTFYRGDGNRIGN